MTPVEMYRVVVVLYAVVGVVLTVLFIQLSPDGEVAFVPRGVGLPTINSFLCVGRSHRVVAKPSTMFASDAFAGGFVVQSFAAYWFYLRSSVNSATLGVIFFVGKYLAGISALLADRLAVRPESQWEAGHGNHRLHWTLSASCRSWISAML